MASRIQATGITSSGSVTTLAKAFASNVTAGNLIVVAVTKDAAADTIQTPTDSLGNTYALAVKSNYNTSNYIFYAMNITGGACTVTVTASSGSYYSVGIIEVSGCATSSALDVTNIAGAATATPSVAAIATTSGMAIGSLGWNATRTCTEEGTWSLIYEQESYSNMTHSSINKVISSGSNTASWTLSGSATCVSCIAIFKDAAGGGGLSILIAMYHYQHHIGSGV